MTSLWRALALAWLGGIASPVLLEEPPIPASIESADVTVPAEAASVAAGEASQDSQLGPAEPMGPDVR